MRRTHRVRLFAPPAESADPYTPSDPAWTPRGPEVDANLQPYLGGGRSGAVIQTPAGRVVEATWRAFVPAGTTVDLDDGLVVVSGVGPTTFRVAQVGPWEAPWDTELLLVETAEVIGE